MSERASLGLEAGTPTAIFQNYGWLVLWAHGTPAIIGHEATGLLILDGDVILPADGATMNERRKIAANGHISVAVALGRNGQINGKPAIRMQGVPVEEERNAFLDEASDAAQEAVSDRFTDLEKLREKVRLAVRRTADRKSTRVNSSH